MRRFGVLVLTISLTLIVAPLAFAADHDQQNATPSHNATAVHPSHPSHGHDTTPAHGHPHGATVTNGHGHDGHKHDHGEHEHPHWARRLLNWLHKAVTGRSGGHSQTAHPARHTSHVTATPAPHGATPHVAASHAPHNNAAQTVLACPPDPVQ
jgi:hypothetical protein